MKNFTKLVWVLLLTFGTIKSQEQVGIIGANNWLRNWTEFAPNDVDYGESTHILTGDITEDMTLTRKNTYVLLGHVFVTNGAILSIEPGTVIMGDHKSNSSLTITKGASILAEGTETAPIVFTSNSSSKKAGDWGGLILLGDAPTNKLVNSNSVADFYPNMKTPEAIKKTNYGGNNTADNSGILQYVRIEYAGRRFNKYIASSAILLASLGDKTQINNVMVSYSAGNSFNVIGGIVDMHSMVSFRSKGNDYKFNNGARSNIHNSLAIRSPYFSDRRGSRCILATSYDKNKELEVDFSKEGTNIFAKNITLITQSKSLDSDINMGLVKEAVYIGNNTLFELSNSVISGFKSAVIIDDKTKINNENLAKIKLTNMYFNNCKGNVFLEGNTNNQNFEAWYKNPDFANVFDRKSHEEAFIKLNSDRPDYRLKTYDVASNNK